MRSGSQPGKINPFESLSIELNISSGFMELTTVELYARTVEPSSHTLASSERVQSKTGIKL